MIGIGDIALFYSKKAVHEVYMDGFFEWNLLVRKSRLYVMSVVIVIILSIMLKYLIISCIKFGKNI